jgi:hypothetical protein
MVLCSEQLQWVAVIEDQQDRGLPLIRRRLNLLACLLDPLPNVLAYRPGVDRLAFEARIVPEFFDFEDQIDAANRHLTCPQLAKADFASLHTDWHGRCW